MLKNLFTSSSRIPKALLLALVLFVSFEIFLATSVENLNDRYTYKQNDVINNHRNIECLYLGDSKISYGIDAEYLTATTGKTHYNFGVDATTPPTQYFYLKNLIENGVKIKSIVLGISKQHLTDIYANRPREAYLCRFYSLENYNEVKSYLPKAQRRAYLLSNTVMHSYKLSLENIGNKTANKIANKPTGFVSAKYGTRSLKTKLASPEKYIKANPDLNNYSIEKINSTYLEKIFVLAKNKEIKISLLVSPGPESIYKSNEKIGMYIEMNKLLRQLSKKHNIKLINISRYYPDEWFADEGHLNENYMLMYTKLVFHNRV
jgi:hypothetical protein